MTQSPEDIRDLEMQIQALLRDHLGVDAVLGICYTGNDEQRRFAFHITKDKVACQGLVHMLWKACELVDEED